MDERQRKPPPFYTRSLAHALMQGEKALWTASDEANARCCEAISQGLAKEAPRDVRDGLAKRLAEEYGTERLMAILTAELSGQPQYRMTTRQLARVARQPLEGFNNERPCLAGAAALVALFDELMDIEEQQTPAQTGEMGGMTHA